MALPVNKYNYVNVLIFDIVICLTLLSSTPSKGFCYRRLSYNKLFYKLLKNKQQVKIISVTCESVHFCADSPGPPALLLIL